MTEFQRPNHIHSKLREPVSTLGIDLPQRYFLEEFGPGEQMYLRPDAWKGLHGAGHSARVNVWGQILTRLLSRRGIEVSPVAIGFFSQTHDLCRLDDGCDPEHGLRAAELFRNTFGYRPDGIVPTVTYLNEWHVPHDWLAPEMTPALIVAKEADTLDRIREEEAFDPRYLRLPESAVLVPLAKRLFLLSIQYQTRYDADPYEAVMEAAVELGLVTDR